jgi:hypothetical protein
MTMYATITDNAGNQSTASAIIGQYYVSGYISNLREANSETCIGDYCNGGANGYLDMLGDCKSAANSTVRLRLTDSNGSELRNINDVSCSSDAFSNNINVNDQLNGVGDGSYRVRAIQCNDNTSECSQQDYNITVDQADTCYVSGSHSDAYPSAGGCGTVNTYDDYTCEHTPPYSVGTGSNYVCNCVGSWNSTSYSNFNNNAGAKYCTVIRTDTSYSYYDNGGFSCGTNYTDSNYSEGFYCGQTLGGYECGGDSSVLNGCWRCTDNTSQNPTDCANNTIVTPSGRTWTAASCSHTDGMGSPYNDESSCTSNTHSSGFTWGYCIGAPEFVNEYDCTLNGQTWTVACTDGSSLDQSSCETDPNTWNPGSCSSGGYVTQYTCENDITTYSWVKDGW